MTDLTPSDAPEFLGPLRDQLLQCAAAHRRRRRTRALAAASGVAVVAVLALTIAVVAATGDDVEVVMAPSDEEAQADRAAPAASITTIDGGSGAGEVTRWQAASTTLAGASYPWLAWTGDRLLVVNTENEGGEVAGEVWDPTTNTATPMAPSGLPWRAGAAMGWTGEDLLVIGGGNGPGLGQIGVAYRPATDTWRPIADPPVTGDQTGWTPAPRGPAMWSGTELVLPASGLAYRPSTDTWRPIARSPLSDRARPVTVENGSKVVVWGGCRLEGTQCDEVNAGLLGDGAVYDVATDTWTALPPGPLTPAVHAVGAWTGDEVVITVTEPGFGAVGARTAAWSPATGAWRVLPDPPMSDRRFAAAVWSGAALVVWGGTTGAGDGAVLDAATGVWRRIEPSPTAPARSLHSMAWAGDRAYISSTLHVATPVTLRLDVEEPVEDPPVASPPVEDPPVGTALPGPGATFPSGQPASPSDLVIGTGYYVDVDLECESFVLGGTWELEDGDPRSWQAPPERHEGGTFTLDTADHGTFVGDAGRTKVATFRLVPPWADLACRYQPR